MESQGSIRYGEMDGCHVFRFEGDIRTVALGGLGVALAFERFVDALMKERPDIEIAFDLTRATAIDSTHLGLIAHTAASSLRNTGKKPVLFSTAAAVTQTMRTMRLDAVVQIVEAEAEHGEALKAIPESEGTKGEAALVHHAHSALAALSEENKRRFQSVLDLSRSDREDS